MLKFFRYDIGFLYMLILVYYCFNNMFKDFKYLISVLQQQDIVIFFLLYTMLHPILICFISDNNAGQLAGVPQTTPGMLQSAFSFGTSPVCLILEC